MFTKTFISNKWHWMQIASIAIFFASEANGQQNLFFAGAREAALANTGVAYTKEWAMFHNPGRLVENSTGVVGAHYTNQFMVTELGMTAFNGIIPVGRGAFGASTAYFGTTRYNQQKYTVGYAHRLGSNFSMGIAGSYASVHLPEEYEPEGVLMAEIGLSAKPVEKLTIACHLYNLTGSKFSGYNSESLPSYFAMGASWSEDLFMLTTEAKVHQNESTEIAAAGEILLFQDFSIRVGASNSKLYQYTWGMGYFFLQRIHCDIAFAHHPTLGVSSFLSLHYTFGELKQ